MGAGRDLRLFLILGIAVCHDPIEMRLCPCGHLPSIGSGKFNLIAEHDTRDLPYIVFPWFDIVETEFNTECHGRSRRASISLASRASTRRMPRLRLCSMISMLMMPSLLPAARLTTSAQQA